MARHSRSSVIQCQPTFPGSSPITLQDTPSFLRAPELGPVRTLCLYRTVLRHECLSRPSFSTVAVLNQKSPNVICKNPVTTHTHAFFLQKRSTAFHRFSNGSIIQIKLKKTHTQKQVAFSHSKLAQITSFCFSSTLKYRHMHSPIINNLTFHCLTTKLCI